ncbi:MAG: GGDEF domain-containing protein [Thermus sp.]|uniref:GGDEF domain-containing protein n=1 Tax=Thermus sp. TaxID=275 RepID=UPI0025DEBC0E|nr:GGDEF domain-containing protein [Thermus sp.]MCS6868576.1 GGDEF domain-containing protein [Thermus sp.]MCS7218434.1 GGDEF domain-containing protein [Thermus sp.]MCX7849243.1 GGDEF domain-containing protein [Thermus sp.]MDW8016811.1 GGDEF domain-containing protein [Thermus sp.]MDW8356962.1 GGDEF domain-containing protein [Thermus sp.]
MNPLEAPYPVFLLRGEEVVANALAQGLPLPQGETLEVEERSYQVVRLPTPEGTYLLLLETTPLAIRARAYQSLLAVLKGLLQHEEPEGLLQDLIREAVAVVPGAEAGSILLREGGFFYLVAQEGFSEDLLGARTSLEEELAWYGLGVDNWLKGRPRVLKGTEIRHLSSLSTVEARPAFFEHGRLLEIQATLGLPIVLEGEVLAAMNLDSFSHPEAFTPLSLELAQAFALEAALLLKAMRERQALQEKARTDPLTGLGNRRALEETFPQLQAEARTLGEPLGLIYWDLNGLKALNDREGHAAGDRALKSLATALKSLSRRRDLAFRVGGDEFVSLHLGLSPEEIPLLIARLQANLPYGVAAGGLCVGEEGLEEALEEADRRMYRAKGGP